MIGSSQSVDAAETGSALAAGAKTGMALGFICYPLAKIFNGKIKELNVVNIVIAVLFALSLAITAFAA